MLYICFFHFPKNLGDGQAVGNAVVSTLLACGTGGLVVLLMWKFIMPHSKSGNVWSLCKFINGCLAAMVTSSAGCNEFYPWISVLVSCISGLIYLLVSDLMVRMQIDDPLDAVAVHGGPGMYIEIHFFLNFPTLIIILNLFTFHLLQDCGD